MQGITTSTKSIYKLIIASAVLFALIGSPLTAFSQLYYIDNNQGDTPKVPVLTLTGSGNSYDEEWYPNGELVTPTSINGPKYIYVPVFIENEWEADDLFGSGVDEFDVDPIESFEFSLLYNGAALKPVDVITEHPEIFTTTEKPGVDDPCDAQDWHISYTFEETDLYRTYLQEDVREIDRRNGMRMRISGVTGGQPLPVHRGFRILLYVKFEVVPQINENLDGIDRSTLIIHNDEIRFNDIDVTDAPPFLEYKDYLLNEHGIDYANYYIEDHWPIPKDNFWNVDKIAESRTQIYSAYMGGISNFDEDNHLALSDPSLPGVLYVQLYSEVPALQFEVNNILLPATRTETLFGEEVNLEFELDEPITDLACESNPSNELPGREVILRNATEDTRIENIEVETSAEWLEVETNRQDGLDFVPQRTRYDVIDYVDNATLAPGLLTVERAAPKGTPGDVILNITCDPNSLPTDPEFEGVYTGYITFRSDNMINSPVRLKVTFIYYRAPEQGSGEPGDDCGVELIVENSNSPVDRANLIFGTADRASDNIDPLFGESAAGGVINGFGARFYLRDRFDEEIFDPSPAPNGLGDVAPNRLEPGFDSRDIRSIDDSTESIIYHVKFDENGEENYPVTISWDTRDFEEDAQYFIRDVITPGTPRLFPSVNMRTANNPSNEPDYIRTFTITDQRVNEFVIEYTPGNVVEYVDEDGNPIIQEGWNFLSLPVKPVDTRYAEIYRNAINEPIYFIPNTYLSESDLRVGRGYFIKYSDIIDRRFAGSSITEISRDLQDSTRVYPGEGGRGGWNSIGALSVPTCIEGISFDQIENDPPIPAPDADYTRKFGVWRYNTRRGYEEVTELLPGLGYFIKVNSNGFYKLETVNCKTLPAETSSRQEIYSNSEEISIKDAANNNGKIYISRDADVNVSTFEMPPKPPVNVFDARFNTNTKLVNTEESVLNVQGVEYPLSLEVNFAAANYEFTDALTGKVLGSVKRGESKVIEITETSSNAIKINYDIPEFDGSINVYPNPVDDFMTVDYKTVNDGNVNISLYSMVGLKVADLYNGYQNSGMHNFRVDGSVFNLSSLAEGRYIIKITTIDGTISAMVNIVRR